MPHVVEVKAGPDGENSTSVSGEWGRNSDFPRFIGDTWRVFLSQPFRDTKMAFKDKKVCHAVTRG